VKASADLDAQMRAAAFEQVGRTWLGDSRPERVVDTDGSLEDVFVRLVLGERPGARRWAAAGAIAVGAALLRLA